MHLVARTVTDSREPRIFLGAPCRRTLLPSVTPWAWVGGLFCSHSKAHPQPPAWLDHVPDSPGTLASPWLPLQPASETPSEQKASAPSLQLR